MRRLSVVRGGSVCALIAAGFIACGGGGGSAGGSDGGPGDDGASGSSGGSGSSSSGSGGSSGSSSSGSGGSSGSSGSSSGGGTDGSVGGGDATMPGDSGGSGDSGSGIDSGNPAGSGDSVLMHHKNLNRDGLYVQPTFTKAAIAGLKQDTTFKASLPDTNDQIYAQPLFVDGMGTGKDLIIVATQANNVYALSGADGSQVWVKNLGTPVPKASMSCGNISPEFGVTGTPVIDWGTRTLYVDALVMATKPQHEIFALNIDTGMIVSGWPVMVNTVAKVGSTTFSDSNHGERGALAVINGMLYVPFGGLYGDCRPYNGWVLAISTTDPTKVTPWATTYQGGGIWAPGGISSDGTNIYVATGNTFNGTAGTWGGGDGIISFGLGSAFGMPTGYYAPTEWLTLDGSDLDMGPTPILFDLAGSTPGHLAITFGKDGDAYLLDRTKLGGVGNALSPAAGQSYTMNVANNQVISAPILYTTATATYAVFKGAGHMCTNSASGAMTAVKIVAGSPPTIAASWCAGSGLGSPIVTTTDGHANAIVWDMGSEGGDNHLSAFDGDTGAAITFTGNTTTISNMRRYNAPIAAKGRIFVPADGTVMAFTL